MKVLIVEEEVSGLIDEEGNYTKTEDQKVYIQEKALQAIGHP